LTPSNSKGFINPSVKPAFRLYLYNNKQFTQKPYFPVKVSHTTLFKPACALANHSFGKDVIAQQIFAEGEAAREVGHLLSVLSCPRSRASLIRSDLRRPHIRT
jgi:hypothetical protein